MLVANTKPYLRARGLTYLARRVENNDCCAIVGISNIGKSALLRQVRRPGVLEHFSSKIKSDEIGFVYIDFNLQLQLTGQGFYELVLRTILTELRVLKTDRDIIAEIENAYNQVVAPTDEFQNALSFNQAIITLCERWPRRLALIFDEFDEIFRGLESRVFLNLRALRDKYPDQLAYIVIVQKRLPATNQDPEAGEFAELFTHHTYHVQPLEQEDIEEVVQAFAAANNIQFSKTDVQFIARQSGGHWGLLETVCQVMAEGAVDRVQRDLRVVRNYLGENTNVHLECVKLWKDLDNEQQQALLELVKTNKIAPRVKRLLLKKGILTVSSPGETIIFGELFEDFVRRQQLVKNKPQEGIVIDVESGHVYVNGAQCETLTKLEYRLLLLLYGHLGKICDKYCIVEAVWGEDYIEEVDDARIEKLVSRLRQKIEATPSEPKYLTTVRGRGYRLQNGR